MDNEFEKLDENLGVTNETCAVNSIPASAETEEQPKAQLSAETAEKTSHASTADVIGNLSKALRIVEDDHLRYMSESARAKQANEANEEKIKREIEAAGDKINAIASVAEARFNDAYANLMNKAPTLIRANIETLAKAEIKGAIDMLLVPLNQGIGAAVREAEICQKKLNQMSWNWRPFVGQIGTGFLAALVVSSLIYFGVLGDMRRYADFGKRTAAKIESDYKPKEQEVVFSAFGGRP